MHQADLGDVNAQRLVGDLCKGGFHALAMRVHADAHLQATIGRDANKGLVKTRDDWGSPSRKNRGAVSRLLGIGRNPHSDPLAVRSG